jgi:hypothetical protein
VGSVCDQRPVGRWTSSPGTWLCLIECHLMLGILSKTSRSSVHVALLYPFQILRDLGFMLPDLVNITLPILGR